MFWPLAPFVYILYTLVGLPFRLSIVSFRIYFLLYLSKKKKRHTYILLGLGWVGLLEQLVQTQPELQTVVSKPAQVAPLVGIYFDI